MQTMSNQNAAKPKCTDTDNSVQLTIETRKEDLGGFSVRRALPSHDRRMVGPFAFFDHFGPAAFAPGAGPQVRPHPHIGLATISYLFDGEIVHRDSLGFVQTIKPGTLNLMTSGRGIVHSERTENNQDRSTKMHGIQAWIALPDGQEECAPAFEHYPRDDIPQFERDGVSGRVIIGEAYGHISPVNVFSPTLYLECRLPKGSELELPKTYREMAIYVVSGDVQIDQRRYAEGIMAVACPDQSLQLAANEDSHVMVIGGDPVGNRHIWWNFVSSSKERIEKAKADWKAQLFEDVPGETEFIPLPE